jgi:serine/threonine protein kinase/predicted Zn-dependent protease
MSLTRSSRIWDETSSPDIELLVERYRMDWKASGGYPPDLRDYLPDDPPARRRALVALSRADLILRRGTREQRPIEWYRDHFPELDDDLLVALLYEEYCLREEDGEAPEAVEYEVRFPHVASSFQDVLAIHELVGRASLSRSRGSRQAAVALPEVGQTIAGFRLVEELGRGAFARVYLAEEQHLADRPVAVKVSRTGSHEPQTLARLQHTHIVPIYSFRTDPATGLHLLCMPYLGRITLLQVLSRAEIRSFRSGAELLDLLDRLQGEGSAVAERAASRQALERRTYAQAIAWWGARLAEALQHAHDRGVLHRDIKPSNVLVTGDGLPMLLDFNLAAEPRIEELTGASAAVGGTLAYMAPEHLEALARGHSDGADARSDLYAMGVVLFDCLVRGGRSFALPSASASMGEALRQAAAARRGALPAIRATHPDVPVALEAVVHRCLAPDRSDRYASAAELAADLQAVADDRPLQFTREPIASRTVRWVRRNRRPLAVATLLVLALAVFASRLISAQLALYQLEADIRSRLLEARHSVDQGQLELGIIQFEAAGRLAQDDLRLRRMYEGIQKESRLARERKESRDRADRLFAAGERLRSSLFLEGVDALSVGRSVALALAEFSIPDDREWTGRPAIKLLDGPRRDRLRSEANELLFIWVVVTLDREHPVNPADARKAVAICDAAMAFATPLAPWRALRDRCQSALDGQPLPSPLSLPTSDTSARGCFQWALLCDLDGRDDRAALWLEQATRLEPENYWAQFYLGYYLGRQGQRGSALKHYEAAVALRPDSPWARINRAQIYVEQRDWNKAAFDLNRVLLSSQGAGLLKARLELGLVKQILGDDAGARAAYDSVIAKDSGGQLARAGRLNRAKLDIDAGFVDRGRAEYDSLLAEDSRDAAARESRAILCLRSGRPAQAEGDLSILLRDLPERADEFLPRRAAARLAAGRLEAAQADAAVAYRRKATPSHERLWVRTLLALGRVEELSWLDRPDDLLALPAGGNSLQADLGAALARLDPSTGGRGGTTSAAARVHRIRAVLKSALADPSAPAEASRAVALAPDSAESLLVRARVRRRAGDREGAFKDVELALLLVPNDPRLLEQRGRLKTEAGAPGAALVDLDLAILRGIGGTVWIPRAQALMALGQDQAALRDWTLAFEYDPEDPEVYLGRALALFHLGRLDQVPIELEKAADWATDRPGLLARITLNYARCLGSSSSRLPRFLALARRAWSAWMASAKQVKSR